MDDLFDTTETPFAHLEYAIDPSKSHALLVSGIGRDQGDADWQGVYEALGGISDALYEKYEGCVPTLLYRYYDVYGCQIYAGITNDFLRRDEQHLYGTVWRSGALFARLELYHCRHLAEEVEAHVIRFEHPEMNVKSPNPFGISRVKYADYLSETCGVLRGACYCWVQLSQGRRWTPPAAFKPLTSGDSTVERMKAAREYRDMKALEAASRVQLSFDRRHST